MPASYPANYRDEFGAETITIFNDGQTLSLVLRGIEFKGNNFHSFNISQDTDLSKRNQFNLYSDELCGYSMDCDIPVWLVSNDETLKTFVHVHVEYGKPEKESNITSEVLQLAIEYQGKVYKSDGKNLYSTFDEQLRDIKRDLPEGIYLKICWSCTFSDYLPSGSGMFGEMGCFRNIKDDYRKVKGKRALMSLWNNRAGDVQEIYLCSEFEKRQAGIGGLYVG